MLLIIPFIGLESASATGGDGVSSGQIIEYSYGFSGTIRDSNDTLISSIPFYVENLETNTIQEVSGTNVSFRCVRDMLNGTKNFGEYWIDVDTGDGSAWLVIIAPDRNPGDMIYPNWLNETHTTVGAFRINQTISLMFRGAEIDVNHMQRMFTDVNQTNYYNYNYYWEKSTGMLVKATLTHSGIADDGTFSTLTTHLQRVGMQGIFYPLIDFTSNPVTVNSNSVILGFDFNQTKQNVILNITVQLELAVTAKLLFLQVCSMAQRLY